MHSRDKLDDCQPSVFDGRYQISRDGIILEHLARFMDAVDCAQSNGNGTEIFDRMAHSGKTDLWQIEHGTAYAVRIKPTRS